MKIKNIADLTKLEEQIYEIVKDHLSETRTINIGDLVPTCFRHFDGAYTKEQIESAMRCLFEKRFFLGVSSLLSADVFENEVRREIFRFVQRNPGAYNRMIRDELGLHSNEFDWHSGMLERFGFLKKIRLNKPQWCYFENRSFMDHE